MQCMYPSACAAALHSIQWDGKHTYFIVHETCLFGQAREISMSVVKLGSDIHLIDYTLVSPTCHCSPSKAVILV